MKGGYTMTDITQDAVSAGIGGALERLAASHQAVKAAAADIYAAGPAAPEPAAGQTSAPAPAAR